MFCCLKSCMNAFSMSPSVPVRIKENVIQLDSTHMGHEVVVVKGGTRVCGSGCALGNAPLVQSKSYFEVKLQQGGVWSVGIATRDTDLERVHGGLDKESWCISSDGIVRHDNVELYHLSSRNSESPNNLLVEDVATNHIPDGPKVGETPIEGDTIGVAFDHDELNFHVNGKNLEVPVRNIKGTVYPALYVDDGAILDVIFQNFLYPPPNGFDRIMIEQSLL